jgi:hypothetical protein
MVLDWIHCEGSQWLKPACTKHIWVFLCG